MVLESNAGLFTGPINDVIWPGKQTDLKGEIGGTCSFDHQSEIPCSKSTFISY